MSSVHLSAAPGTGDLFRWQTKAIDAWFNAGGRGIIEGMTGTGKTHVAFKAIRRLLDAGHRVSPLIVVPTRALLDQWLEKLRAEFPQMTFGRIGDGSHDTFARSESGVLPMALVSTIHSAVPAVQAGLFDHCAPNGINSLLIADECHRYINEDQLLFNRILQHPYDHTLGLSATIDRFEVPGLGKIEFTYDINSAVRDGVIPSFDVINVALELSATERANYLRLSETMKHFRQQLHIAYPLLNDYDGDCYWRYLKRLAEDGDTAAQGLLGCTFKRSAISHESAAKLRLIPQVIEFLVSHAHRKLLVFFERIWTSEAGQEDLVINTARKVRDQLRGNIDCPVDDPIWCEVYHSQMTDSRRDQVLERFRNVGASALLACKSLDEGLDVPSVDVGVLVASTQSERQRLQRIGRTLRRGDGDKKPLILILYVKGTSDSNVAIHADDPQFKDAATVFHATPDNVLHTIEQVLAGKAVAAVPKAPPAPPLAPARQAATINPSDYHWTEMLPAAASKAQRDAILRRLPKKTMLKIACRTGKTYFGHLRLIVGDELLLTNPDQTLSLRDVQLIWSGIAQSTTAVEPRRS